MRVWPQSAIDLFAAAIRRNQCRLPLPIISVITTGTFSIEKDNDHKAEWFSRITIIIKATRSRWSFFKGYTVDAYPSIPVNLL